MHSHSTNVHATCHIRYGEDLDTGSRTPGSCRGETEGDSLDLQRIPIIVDNIVRTERCFPFGIKNTDTKQHATKSIDACRPTSSCIHQLITS